MTTMELVARNGSQRQNGVLNKEFHKELTNTYFSVAKVYSQRDLLVKYYHTLLFKIDDLALFNTLNFGERTSDSQAITDLVASHLRITFNTRHKGILNINIRFKYFSCSRYHRKNYKDSLQGHHIAILHSA
jgi:hypothetical protein